VFGLRVQRKPKHRMPQYVRLIGGLGSARENYA
jgi:hypothetical protein